MTEPEEFNRKLTPEEIRELNEALLRELQNPDNPHAEAARQAIEDYTRAKIERPSAADLLARESNASHEGTT